MENQWLVQNNRRVQQVKRLLVEYSYQSTQELPAQTILQTLESAVIEIARVQKELEEAQKEIRELKAKQPNADPVKQDEEK